MKDLAFIFLVWIFLQLVVIGVAEADRQFAIERGTYTCSVAGAGDGALIGALFPLWAFVPESPRADRYCEHQRQDQAVRAVAPRSK